MSLRRFRLLRSAPTSRSISPRSDGPRPLTSLFVHLPLHERVEPIRCRAFDETVDDASRL